MIDFRVTLKDTVVWLFIPEEEARDHLNSHKRKVCSAIWIQLGPIYPLSINFFKEMNHCKCRVFCDLMSCYLEKLRIESNSGIRSSSEIVVICAILCFLNSSIKESLFPKTRM